MKIETGDKGQRFEVVCCKDDKNIEVPFGWSDHEDGTDAMIECINLHPS